MEIMVSQAEDTAKAIEGELIAKGLIPEAITAEARKCFDAGDFSNLTVGELRRLHNEGLLLTKESTGALPKDLANPKGLVGEIYRWIASTAHCNQPRFALGAALVVCGTIFGRKVKTVSGQYTNLFAMNVGKTSSGKDHPRKSIDRLLDECHADHLRRSKVTSDAAIEAALATTPNLLITLDEAGHFFNTVNSSMAASYSRTIKQTFLNLWSAAGTTWLGKQRGRAQDGDSNVVRVVNPHICFLGGTQPEILFDGLRSLDLKDGWIPRVLYFISMARPFPTFRAEEPIPSEIMGVVEKWIGTDGLSRENTAPVVLNYTEDAAKFRDLCMIHNRNTSDELEKVNPVYSALYGKCIENAERVAAILAVGRHTEDPEKARIEYEDYLYAYNLVTFLTMTMQDLISLNLADSKEERYAKAILRLIGDAGDDGITKTELTKRTRFIGASRIRNTILAELIENNEVRKVSIDKGGEKYFAV